jgi:hypothetical protein
MGRSAMGCFSFFDSRSDEKRRNTKVRTIDVEVLTTATKTVLSFPECSAGNTPSLGKSSIRGRLLADDVRLPQNLRFGEAQR